MERTRLQRLAAAAVGLAASACFDFAASDDIACGEAGCPPGTYCAIDGFCRSGDNPCPAGQAPLADQCTPFDPADTAPPSTTATPPAGAYRSLSPVTLATDEPAIVYYTTDGSEPGPDSASGLAPIDVDVSDGTELRFYAVDVRGNHEPTRTASYVLDLDPPAPVAGLAAQPIGSDATRVSWTLPDDADAVLLARMAAGTNGGPEPGTHYTSGDLLPGGHEVVFVGSTTEHEESALAPGPQVYGAWAVDAAGNYARIRLARALLPIPGQNATLALDTAAGTVSVSTQPPHMELSASVAAVDAGAGTATLTIGIENRTAGVVYAPKLVVTNLPMGSVASADGTLDGDPFVRAGVALERASTRDATLSFTGLPTQSILVEVRVEVDPLIIGGHWTGDANAGSVTDSGSFEVIAQLPVSDEVRGEGRTDPDDFKPPSGFYHGEAISLDGRTLYVGGRQSSKLAVIDLRTMAFEQLVSIDHIGERASVYRVLADHQRNYLYALVIDGSHGSRFRAAFIAGYLVKLDATTLEEVGRVTLATIAGPTLADETDAHQWLRPRRFAISPDGTLAAIPVAATASDPAARKPTLHLIDLESMTERDSEPETPGTQPILLGDQLDPAVAAFAPDGGAIYLGPRPDAVDKSRIARVSVADGSVEIIEIAESQGIYDLEVESSGTLLLLGFFEPQGMYRFDPGTDTAARLASSTVNVSTAAWSPAVPGALFFNERWSSTLRQGDPVSGATTRTTVAPHGLHGHWLMATPW